MPKRKCKQCKNFVSKFIQVPAGVFCNMEHAITFVCNASKKQREKRIAKEKSNKKKIEKINRKALIDLNKRDLQWQHKQTQPVFNKMRKLQELKWFADRGLEAVCMSCQKPLGNDQWCNGHFKTVGANGRLRYDPMNSYLQHNRQCNMGLSGDINGYKEGLVVRFGSESAREIIDYCETNNAPKKYTWQDIEEIRKECNKIIKQINEGITK